MSMLPAFPQPEDPSYADRRYEPRLRCSLTIAAATGPEQCSVTVRDISPGGIGLVSSQSFPSGITLTIQIRQGDEVVLSKQVRLRNVRKESEDRWFLGGSFPERLTKKELKLFL